MPLFHSKKTIITIAFLLFVLPASSANPSLKYLDPSQSIEVRVKDLMQRMTLEEKVGQMCQYVAPSYMLKSKKNLESGEQNNSDAYSLYRGMTVNDVEKLVAEGMIGSFLHVTTPQEVNSLQLLAQQSRLKIPLLIGIDAIHGNGLVSGATVYPSPITLSSMWCDSLVTAISSQTAIEMRAMGAHWTFTPNIDIAHDARWGRFGETCGEDPYLVGRTGIAQIKGFQGDGFPGKNNVIACAKHMIGGGDPVNGTNAAPTDVSPYTLRTVHLPPYEMAVKEAGVYTVMMAHNELNGMPCHASNHLMSDILRGEYNFKGFVVSDWMDMERIAAHGVAPSEEDAFVMSVAAGIDMHMHGPKFFEEIVKAVREGRLKEARINEACSKILEAKFRLGLFENTIVNLSAIETKTFTPEHRATALEAARKGIILLKNNSLLPLSGKEKSGGRKLGKIFLSGLNADNHAILGDWVFQQPTDHVVTIRHGLADMCAQQGVEFNYFDCGKMVSRFPIDDRTDEAVRVAQGADLAVVAVGENPLRYLRNATCGENIDRADITLLNNQTELIRRLKAAGIPVVVIFVTGRPLADEWIAENADAIIWAWEPGCMGGSALAEILFGKMNPSGKLTATIPRHVGQTKIYYNTKPFHYFHPPIDIAKGPLYHFGYGLSYTEYQYSDMRLSSSSIAPKGHIRISVDVANVGDREGEEIVQLYIRDKVSSLTRPVKELKDYRRITLTPGQKRTVTFTLDTRMLAGYDPDMKLVTEKGTFVVMIGKSSRNEDLLTKEFEMTENEYFKNHLNSN